MTAKKLTEKMVREEPIEELREEPIKKNQAGSVALVRMARDPVYGTPHEAMVHPDEVANWQAHNWQVAE